MSEQPANYNTTIQDLLEADEHELQIAAKQIFNRINQVRQEMSELTPYVERHTGLKSEFAALRTMADTVKRLLGT